MDEPCLKAALLAAAAKLLQQIGESVDGFSVQILTGGAQIKFTSNGEYRPAPDGLAKPLAAVLAAFQPGESLSRDQVARRLGRESNSRLGQYLADLVNAGHLQNGDEGYRLI